MTKDRVGNLVRRSCAAAGAAALLGAGLSASAAPGSTASAARPPVTLTVLLSPTVLSPGKTGQLVVKLRVDPGWHVNSNKPTESYLIPTVLKVDVPPPLRAQTPKYPAGKSVLLSFNPKPLSLYEGTVAWKVPVTVPPGTPTGAKRIAVQVQYQACDTKSCQPPSTLRVSVPAQIAGAGAKPPATDRRKK